MKKGNYFLDEHVLGIHHSLFNGNNGIDKQNLLIFISGAKDLKVKGVNQKGIRYFQPHHDPSLDGEEFYQKIVHPEDYPFFLHYLKQSTSLSCGEQEEITLRVRTPFGSWKKFHMRSRIYEGGKQDEEKLVLHMAQAIDPFRPTFKPNQVHNMENEKALQESRDRYRVLVNSLDDGFCIIEVIFNMQNKPVDHLFVEINPAFERHIHLNNPLGKTIKELSRNHGKKWFETYGRIITTGEAVRFEDYASDLGVWLDIYAFPVGNSRNRKVAILCSDITARKKNEQVLKETNEVLENKVRNRTAELKDQNELLEMVFDTVNQGIFILKPKLETNGDISDFTYVKVNKIVKRYYKLPRLSGRSLKELNPQVEENGTLEVFKEVMRTGKSRDFEVYFQRDGKKNWFRITTRRQKNLLFSSLENITREKIRTQRMRDNIRFKKQLITASPDIILILNLEENRIRFVNRDFSSNAKLSKEKLVGMPLDQVIHLVHPIDRKLVLKFHKAILRAADKDVVDLEFRLEGKRGEWIYYNARAKIFMRSNSGRPVEYIVLLRNIQEQKQTQKALITAEKLSIKGEIAKTLAHELRNPLASIGMSADILDRRIGPDQKELTNYINIIKRSSSTLNHLVTDLLTSARYSPAVLRKCCLASTMNLVLKEVKDRIYLAGIQAVKNYKGQYYILADKEKLKIALLNIVVNATEAVLPQEGILTISIDKLEDQFSLSISDNGCGMESEQLEKLFESFYTSKKGGMGIGLNSVKNILEEHGAAVKVASEPQKGTTFTLTFPCYQRK